MASQRQLKGRIRSVKSTRQITKAMQMVAASKMRRAQDATRATSDYTNTAVAILSYLASQGVTQQHPLFARRDIRRRLVIVIAADKGLAGAYNSNVLKSYIRLLRDDKAAGIETRTIAVGRKAAQFAARLKQADVLGTYVNLADDPEGAELYAILNAALEQFALGEVDAVDLVYTKFVNSISQVAQVQSLLPAGFTETEVRETLREALYEPSTEVVLEGVVRRLISAQLYQALLDARASEHSMRMMAMKNATDNAGELVEDLTLAMNKARQAAITQELAEISGGAEAMK